MAAPTPSPRTQLLKQGPFAGRMDPFAEAGRYFQQIHAGMIDNILEQIQDPLLEMGYSAGREASLQIAENRQPDLNVSADEALKPPLSSLNYALAAEGVRAQPGIALESPAPELMSVAVRALDDGVLVTVLEIVSPRNKAALGEILEYQERRDRLLARRVNVVEIDLTRSVKRLVEDTIATTYAYHMAVHLPGQVGRFVGIEFEEMPGRLALPLREEVLPVEITDAYQSAYQRAAIAVQIRRETRYTDDGLPFPTLLSNAQQAAALQAVQKWQQELARLADADD